MHGVSRAGEHADFETQSVTEYPQSFALPYECRGCGRAMRTFGPYCDACNADPKHRCRGYKDKRGRQLGCLRPVQVEDAQCGICGRAQTEVWWRQTLGRDERARQDRRDGVTYGPAQDGNDVWRGFEEG